MFHRSLTVYKVGCVLCRDLTESHVESHISTGCFPIIYSVYHNHMLYNYMIKFYSGNYCHIQYGVYY